MKKATIKATPLVATRGLALVSKAKGAPSYRDQRKEGHIARIRAMTAVPMAAVRRFALSW